VSVKISNYDRQNKSKADTLLVRFFPFPLTKVCYYGIYYNPSNKRWQHKDYIVLSIHIELNIFCMPNELIICNTL